MSVPNFITTTRAKILSFAKQAWAVLWQRKYSITILILILISAGYWFTQQNGNEVAYTFRHPERKNLEKTLAISGVVDAKEKARLRFLNGGKITYIGATEGETVKRGQTIASIDQRAQQKQLEQDLNQFMQQRLIWDQTNVDIFKDEYTTDEERIRQRAELDLQNRVLAVEIRTVGIESNRLSAPFDGILTISPTLVTGVQLTAADFFEIVNPESLLFKAAVDEIDLAGLEKGLPAVFELDAFPNQVFETNLDYISFTATDTSTRTVFFVEFPIDTQKHANHTFRIGMNGEARITLDTRSNVLTVPLRATRERDSKTFVDVQSPLNPNQIEEREIIVGLETNDDVEVLSGLTENDLVVIP